MKTDSVFNFPCEFPIKAIGKKDNFKELVCAIISKHTGNITPNNIKTKPSSNAKYLSVTVVITATSKVQLDAIYKDMSDNSNILWTL